MVVKLSFSLLASCVAGDLNSLPVPLLALSLESSLDIRLCAQILVLPSIKYSFYPSLWETFPKCSFQADLLVDFFKIHQEAQVT